MKDTSALLNRQGVVGTMTIICVFCILFAIAQSSAIFADDNVAPAAKLLEEFRAAWDDSSWEPTKGKMSKYLRPADDRGFELRARTLRAIARLGLEAGPSLRDALKSETTSVRVLAAQALGFSGDVEGKPDLARVVEHDPDAMVRLYAADSLGMLGGREHDSLLKRLESSEKNGDVKRHLRYALEREGTPVEADIVTQLRQWNPEVAGSAKLGELAPDFKLTAVSGETVKLSDYRGKSAVILVFVYGDT